MEETTTIKKEIIVNDSSNNEIQPINNENTNGEDNENKNEIKGLKPKKIILNKNFHNLKGPNQKEKLENEFVPNIEIEVNNYGGISNSQELSNTNNINQKKEEIIDNSNKSINEKNNEQSQNQKKLDGYLDDDLDDEDNKKLYLRVIKRMEKTYGVPVVGAKIPGEPIKDIEIEENIRPILINNDKMNNKKKEIQGKENINNNKNNLQNNAYKNIYRNNVRINNYIPKKVEYGNQQRNINKYAANIPNNYNYKIYNSKGSHQYKHIYNPINYNKSPNQQLKYNYNNYNSASNQYINMLKNKYKNTINIPHSYNINPSINNKTPQYGGYSYQMGRYEIPNRSLSSLTNKPYSNNINSRIISNQKSIINPLRAYSYEKPKINLQRKYETIIQKYNNNNINTRYNGYLNNKNNKTIGEKKNNPLRQQNYYYNNVGQSLQIYKLPGRNNNFNNMRKTYYICSNKSNVPRFTKDIQNLEPNKLKNNNGTHYLTQSLINKRSPIIPKRTNIQNYDENILKNRYYSPSINLINKKYSNVNSTPINQKSIIPMNRIHKNYSFKNNNYQYSDLLKNNNNYGSNNRNLSQNPLARSQNNTENIVRKTNNLLNNYLSDNYFLNYDYGYKYGNPGGDGCFTYFID